MCGKIILYTIIIYLFNTVSADKTGEIKAGLLYEKTIDDPVIINPTYHIFTRRIDLQTIRDAVKLTQEFTTSYKNFCDRVNAIIDGTYAHVYVQKNSYLSRYIITDTEHEYKDAHKICAQQNCILPEIRTITELRLLRNVINDYNLTYIPAGLKYNTQLQDLRYASDDGVMINLIDKIRWFSKTDKKFVTKLIYEGNPPYTDNDITYLYYLKPPRGEIVLANEHEGYKGKITCQMVNNVEQETQQNHFLLKITAHLCTKDYIEIKSMTDTVTREVTLFEPVQRAQKDDPQALTRPNTNVTCPTPQCQQCELIKHLAGAIIELTVKLSIELNITDTYKIEQCIILKALQLPDKDYVEIFSNTKQFSEHRDLYKADMLKHIQCKYLTPADIITNDITEHEQQQFQNLPWTSLLKDVNKLLHIMRPTNRYRRNLDTFNLRDIKPEGFEEKDAQFIITFYYYALRLQHHKVIHQMSQNVIQNKPIKTLCKQLKEIASQMSILAMQPVPLRMVCNEQETNNTKYFENRAFGCHIANHTIHCDIPNNQTNIRKKRWILWPLMGKHVDFETMIKENRENRKFLLNNTQAIQALSINQQEIQLTYNKLARELTLINNISRINEFAIATLMSEIDAKTACVNLQNAIQFALLKLADAMSLAGQNKVSPYVLSEKELDDIVSTNSKHQIHLSNNIHHAEATLQKTDQEYLFVISVPIVDNNHLYKLYQISSIPIFNNNEAYTLIPDTNYLGISMDTTKYITFSTIEYIECLKRAFCRARSPTETIAKSPGCAAYSYRSGEITCPAQKLTPPVRPFFATYGNQTIYSTENNYTVEVICPNVKATNIREPIIGKTDLSGIGIFTLDPNCFMQTQDNRRIVSHIKPDSATDLGITTMEQALHNLPKVIDIRIPDDNPLYKHIEEHQLDLMDTHPQTITQVPKELYKPREVISHVLRDMLIVFTLILMFSAIACCFPQVRAWAKACCFINNPTKYWRRYKHYNVPDFPKVPNLFSEDTNNPIIKRITATIRRNTAPKDSMAKHREQIFRNKFEIDEIINKNKAAVEAQCRIITAPIIQHNAPLKPTAPTPKTPELDTTRINKHVQWADNN
jgi:hypothetical protein